MKSEIKLLLLCDLALKESNIEPIELQTLQNRLRALLEAELIEGHKSAKEALEAELKAQIRRVA